MGPHRCQGTTDLRSNVLMPSPAVSLLMPVHNGSTFLQQALESVWSQDFSDLELIVVDDASDDDTNSILNAVKDERLRLIRLPNRSGLGGALVAGLAMCEAPLVARLDADDLCMPGRIRKQVDAMQQRPNLCILGTSAIRIDSEGRSIGQFLRPTGSARVLRHLRWHNVLIHSCVMFQREIAREVGGYMAGMRYGEDYHLWLRMATMGEIDNLEGQLVSYRVHP